MTPSRGPLNLFSIPMKMKTKTLTLAALTTALACLLEPVPAVAQDADRPWIPLFDGESLDNWTQRNGTATYRVEDGTIVGRTSEGSPNSFLATKNDYADFELTFEVKVDDALNSGVQIRSRSVPEFKKGRVHGPQVEIAAKGSSGSVYGEGLGTGWLHQNKEQTPAASFQPGEWNRYRVKAVGTRIQTWINGTPIVDFEETTTGQSRGFIGLQVHGIRKGTGPYEVRWRDIRVKDHTRRKVVFIGKGGGHGSKAHMHIEGNALMADALEDSGLAFETAAFDGWPEDSAAFDGADAVVVFCNGGQGHLLMPHLDAFDAVMKRGVGLMCLHFAVEIPEGRPGDLMMEWMGGYFETHWSVNPHWNAAFASLPKHEITRGVKPFAMDDEWYYHMKFAKDMAGVTPVLSAHPPAKTAERPDGPHSNNQHVKGAIRRGEIQHLAWAYERPDSLGGGRGFGCTGAHWHHNWFDDDFRTAMLNAIVWISGADVPAGGVSSDPAQGAL